MNIGSLFYASYDNGVGCAGCDTEICEGDRIAYVDGELQCEECVKELMGQETSKFTKKWGERKK